MKEVFQKKFFKGVRALPVTSNYQVPFLPQTGTSEAILAAIQAANEAHFRQRQLALQRAAQPSEIELRKAEASRYDAQTALDKMNMDLRRELIGTLMGGAPGSAQPATAQAATAATNQPPLNPKDFASPGEFLQAVSARNAQPQAPAPAPAFKVGGLIGQTVNGLLADPNLKPEDRQALMTAGNQAVVKMLTDPQNALDSVTSTYNDILKRRGETERAIKTELQPDSQSSTGYSNVATRADGGEAYRHPVAPPVPKNLEEASAYLGSASLNYQRNATPGNKSALTLAQTQHDAMYKDKLAETALQARATAQAQGKDYEAMVRTGVNPITKEKLSLNNAPPGALVNPTTGEVIPQDNVSLYKPTMNERQTADTARQVLAISQNLKNEIAKNPNLIGPLAGRSQEALQKIGISSQAAAKLIDDVTFLQSAATKMHTGRFSAEILHKMGTIVKPGMSRDEFLGSLESISDVATRYSNEDKLTTVFEYQQRQQFENQNANAGAALPGVAQKHGFE